MTAALTLGFIAFHYSITIITSNENERIQMLSRRTDDQLNQYLHDMRIAFSMLAGEIVAIGPAPSHADIVAKLETYRHGPATFWQEVYYITEDGRKYPSTAKDPSGATLAQIYGETVRDITNLHAIGPYMDPSRGLVFSLSRTVRHGADISGVLVADVDLAKLSEIMTKINFDHHISMVLYNRRYEPVLADIKLPSDRFIPLLPKLKEWLADERNGHGFIEADETRARYLITRTFIGFNDFSLVFFVDENSFLAKVRQLRDVSAWLAAAFSLVIILWSLHLARYINKPITKMIREMAKVKRGDLKTRIRFRRDDEFRTLASSFNDMLTQIETLIEQKTQAEVMKKQFELKALQSQINPHFLFNTLNSINALIDLRRTEQIPTIVSALVRLFQFTMDRKGEWVTIAEELQGLEYYVELQQVRYANKFRVEWRVDEEIMPLGILKLTLQPLVENAVFHGVKGSRRQGVIAIGGGRSPDGSSVVLFVEDNGVGMPPERLAGLLEREEPAEREGPAGRPDGEQARLGHPDGRQARQGQDRTRDRSRPETAGASGFNSIGLRNVHDRLRLHFGPDCGLAIRSAPGSGTRVEIRYPASVLRERADGG